jgi:hypothetical protein
MQLLTLLNSFTKKILGGFVKMQKKTTLKLQMVD